MYEIDMLKGREAAGNNWFGMVLTGAAFFMPVALAFVISIGYFNDKASISAYREEVSDYEFQLREMEGEKKRIDGVTSKNEKQSAWLGDVGEVLSRHSQWTNILMAIRENLPDSLLVNKLDVNRKMVTMVVDQRYGDEKKINVSVPVRTLVISLYSTNGQSDDAAVRGFQRSLVAAEAFRKRVKDVVIALRKPDVVEGRDVVRYELNCIMNSN